MTDVLRFYEPDDPATGYLSNFHRAPFDLDGQSWSTVEHYYQAQKFADETYAERIRQATSPREAKSLGQVREMPLREDWATHRMTAMLSALVAKFTQHAELRTRLLATGDALLVEASRTDSFWGDGVDGRGENRLGYLLTTLREQLRLALSDDATSKMSLEALAQQCFSTVRLAHVTWFLPDGLRMEAQLGTLPDSLNAYVRDVDLPDHCLALYRPGLIFREPTPCDASEHMGGFAARHRYLMLSGNAKHLDALFGGLSGSPGTGLCVWVPGSLWKVLAVHQADEHTQITLLEIPPVALHAFNAQALTTLEQGLADKAGEQFRRALQQPPVPASAAPEWLERLHHPLGIQDDGRFLECWFNGIHQGAATSDEPNAATPPEDHGAAEPPMQPSAVPGGRTFKRVLGIVVMLIGGWIGLGLAVSSPSPPQMIFLALVMIVFGAFVTWRPDDIQ